MKFGKDVLSSAGDGHDGLFSGKHRISLGESPVEKTRYVLSREEHSLFTAQFF